MVSKKTDSTSKLIYQIQLDLSEMTDQDRIKPFFSKIAKHINQLETEYLAPVELVINLKGKKDLEYLIN